MATAVSTEGIVADLPELESEVIYESFKHAGEAVRVGEPLSYALCDAWAFCTFIGCDTDGGRRRSGGVEQG